MIIWPVLLYMFAVAAVIGIMIGVSYILGQRHKDKATGEAYESGILITGSARLRFSSQFYIIAMFFLIFDLEAIFIVTWAIAFREVGWVGYIGISIFIGILVIVLIYEWRIGALDFAVKGKTINRKYKSLNKSKYVK